MSLFNPPSPPNPQQGIQLGQQVAQGQQDLNTQSGIQSQAGSMVNQYNPYGSLTYAQTGTGPGGVPMYSSSVNLTPQQQQMFDVLQGTKSTAGQAGNALMTNANYGSTNPATTIGDATSGNTAALMKTQTDYLQPFFTTQRSQLDTQLRNQGLAPGNPAYDNAMRGIDTSQTNAVGAIAGQFEPQAYQQATQNYLLPGTLAENLAGFGAPGNPTSELTPSPALNIQPANLVGATSTENSALNQQYQAQQQQYSAMMSGLMGIPTAMLGGWAKGGFPGASSLLGGSSMGAGLSAGDAAGATAAVDGGTAAMDALGMAMI